MTDAPPLESVLIVDDHALIRDGLRGNLSSAFPACTIAEAGSFAEALAQLEAMPAPDLVLLDRDSLHVQGGRAVRIDRDTGRAAQWLRQTMVDLTMIDGEVVHSTL